MPLPNNTLGNLRYVAPTRFFLDFFPQPVQQVVRAFEKRFAAVDGQLVAQSLQHPIEPVANRSARDAERRSYLANRAAFDVTQGDQPAIDSRRSSLQLANQSSEQLQLVRVVGAFEGRRGIDAICFIEA